MVVMAGTPDDTGFVRPTADIFREEAQPWVPMAPDTERHPRHDGWPPTRV